MTKHELLLCAKAHVKAAEQVAERLTAELLAEAPRTGPYIEVGNEKIVVVPVEPKLTAVEAQSLLDEVTVHLPGAERVFLGARFTKDTLAQARGGTASQRDAAALYDAYMARKREQREAEGKDRTVQVTVSPERVAEHRAAIEEAFAMEAASQAAKTAPAQERCVEQLATSFMDGFE